MEKQLRDNLYRIRKEKKLSQKQMADKLGISRVAYVNIEKGKTHLVNENVEKFAELNGVTPSELVLGYKMDDEDAHTLRQAQDDYGRRRQELVTSYEERIAALNREIDDLKQQVADLRDSIDTKNDIINLLRKQNSPENP